MSKVNFKRIGEMASNALYAVAGCAFVYTFVRATAGSLAEISVRGWDTEQDWPFVVAFTLFVIIGIYAARRDLEVP